MNYERVFYDGYDGTSRTIDKYHYSKSQYGSPKGAILLVPGYADYPSSYKEAANLFNEAGFTVFVPGMRGVEASEGERNQIENLKGHEEDLAKAFTILKNDMRRDMSLFLVAHSMGCALSSNAIFNGLIHPDDLKGVVFSAPQVWVHPFSFWERYFSKIFQIFSQFWNIKIPVIPPKKRTRNPELLKSMVILPQLLEPEGCCLNNR